MQATAEALARTTADGLQNTAINNTDAISANFRLEQQQMVFKTQLFLIIRMQQQKLQLEQMLTAETLARTTADGLQNTAISNNTDAITTEATTNA
jgi:ABC-type phosphate transport system auxiliary subunit